VALSKVQWKTAPGFRRWRRGAGRAGASLIGAGGLAAGLLAIGIEVAGAQSGRGARYDAAAKPVLAIVSLSDQRVSIYDSEGKILESPVSTGAPGYETPAGIFTIVQKKEEHRSNLYEDGEMPFMQRITWTGIALHAGILPGHAASHGCVRLPMGFAQRLFGMTDLGMRVLIVRDDMRPSDITQPALFRPKPVPRELALAAQRSTRLAALAPGDDITPGSATHLQLLQWAAAEKLTELEMASARQRDARNAATRTSSEAAAAARAVRAGELELARAENALKDAEVRLGKSDAPEAKQRAETGKTKALAKVEELQAKLQAARLQEQAKREAAERAGEEAKAAAGVKDRTAQAAEEAKLRTLPVSVFVSRKTQRLYIRKGNVPVFEAPVAIRDPQAPIGTFIFTAVEPGAAGAMRWNVVAMYRNPTSIEPAPDAQSGRGGARNAGAAPTDVKAAFAALGRIAPTDEALDIISEVVLPGASLIISDEGPSRETGKDTDFVVVMSDEPQGALKIRQRERRPVDEFDGPPWGGKSPWGGTPFFWKW
jgi:hypothetical protein